jgi:hypothetical protein
MMTTMFGAAKDAAVEANSKKNASRYLMPGRWAQASGKSWGRFWIRTQPSPFATGSTRRSRIGVEHRGAFFSEGRLTIILLLPDGDAVPANPRAAKRGRKGTAEGTHGHELVALKPLRELFQSPPMLGNRRDQVECHAAPPRAFK